MSSSRLRMFRDAAFSMHPAAWLWAFLHRNPNGRSFDLIYKLSGGDPWRVENSDYEDRKRADTIAMMRASYDDILDVGCGTGTLTRILAQRGPVTGLDASAEAIKHARKHPIDGVTYDTADLRTMTLTGLYDLVVASEVLYYLPDSDRESVIERLIEALRFGGHFVVVGGRDDPRVIPAMRQRRDLTVVGEIVREGDVWRPYRVVQFEKVA